MDQDHKKMTENLVIKLKFQARTRTHTHSINRKLHAFLNAEGPFGTLATFSEAPWNPFKLKNIPVEPAFWVLNTLMSLT